MKLRAVGTSLAVVIAAVSALAAGATVWLLLTDPMTVASSLNDGDLGPLVEVLARAVVDAFRGLLAML